MASITDSELKRSIKEILENADLSTLSAKKVRLKLEMKFDIDFTDRKKAVDAMTMALLSEQIEEKEKEKEKHNGENEKDDDLSSDEDKPDPSPPNKKLKTSKTPAGKSSSLSSSDSSPPNKKSKTSKEPISKSSSLSSDDDDGDDADQDDEEVARKLQEEEETTYRRPSRSVAKKPTRRKPREKKDKVPREKTKSIYSKPCQLSDDLADIMGAPQMARNEIVKRMWEIVKERNLQDPKNKQWMICDDQLQKVFGKKKIKTFAMMKYLKNHIKDEKYLNL